MPQITLDIPTAAVPRLRAAVRERFPSGIDEGTGEPYPEPTDAEMIAWFKEMLRERAKEFIREYELRKAQEQVFIDHTDVEVT